MNRFNSFLTGSACKQLFWRQVSIGVLVMLGTMIGSLSAATRDVQAMFNPVDPAIGPFPSNPFTVADRSQVSGRRVTMQPRSGIEFEVGPPTRAK